jgi:hypothetical protein
MSISAFISQSETFAVTKGYIRGRDGAAGVNSESGSSVEGGGLYNSGGNVSVIDCSFSGNSAVGGKAGARHGGKCGRRGIHGSAASSQSKPLKSSTASGSSRKRDPLLRRIILAFAGAIMKTIVRNEPPQM